MCGGSVVVRNLPATLPPKLQAQPRTARPPDPACWQSTLTTISNTRLWSAAPSAKTSCWSGTGRKSLTSSSRTGRSACAAPPHSARSSHCSAMRPGAPFPPPGGARGSHRVSRWLPAGGGHADRSRWLAGTARRLVGGGRLQAIPLHACKSAVGTYMWHTGCGCRVSVPAPLPVQLHTV